MENCKNVQVFEEYEYMGLNIQNRIVCTDNKTEDKRLETTVEEIGAKYEGIAKKQPGLIVVQDYLIAGIEQADTPNGNLSSRISIKKAREICKKIHNYGVRVVFQAAIAKDDKRNKEGFKADTLSELDVSKLIRRYIRRALRIEEAYADGVMLQFVPGFLMGEILWNRADGTEIAGKVIRGIRNNLPYFPILIKIPGKLGSDKLEALIKICKKYSVWAIEVEFENELCCTNQIKMIKSMCNIPIIVTKVGINMEKAQEILAMGASLVRLDEQ